MQLEANGIAAERADLLGADQGPADMSTGRSRLEEARRTRYARIEGLKKVSWVQLVSARFMFEEASVNIFVIRHGETAWSLEGRHTGTTDVSLTDNGRRLAGRLKPILARNAFRLALCSPMLRARETCDLAGFGDTAVIDADLVEWNYGDYEGLTRKQIQEIAPGWLIFRDGCPAGEAPEQVATRVDRVIARSRAIDGDTVLFAHGHVLRVLAARWIGLPALGGQHFLLHTGAVSVLGFYREIPALRVWNAPLLD